MYLHNTILLHKKYWQLTRRNARINKSITMLNKTLKYISQVYNVSPRLLVDMIEDVNNDLRSIHMSAVHIRLTYSVVRNLLDLEGENAFIDELLADTAYEWERLADKFVLPGKVGEVFL